MAQWEVANSGDTDTFYNEMELKSWLISNHDISLSQPLQDVPDSILLNYTVRPIVLETEPKSHEYQKAIINKTRDSEGYLTITKGWVDIELSKAQQKVINRLMQHWDNREPLWNVTQTIGVTEVVFPVTRISMERMGLIALNSVLGLSQPSSYDFLAINPLQKYNLSLNDVKNLLAKNQALMDLEHEAFETHLNTIYSENNVSALAEYDVTIGWPNL